MKHFLGRAYRMPTRYETIFIAVVCRENPRLVYFKVTPTQVEFNWDYKESQESVDSYLVAYTEELKADSLTSAQLLSIIECAHNVNVDNLPAKNAAEEAAQILEQVILGDV